MKYDDSLAVDVTDLANSLRVSIGDAIFLTMMPHFPFTYVNGRLVVRMGDLNTWLKVNELI